MYWFLLETGTVCELIFMLIVSSARRGDRAHPGERGLEVEKGFVLASGEVSPVPGVGGKREAAQTSWLVLQLMQPSGKHEVCLPAAEEADPGSKPLARCTDLSCSQAEWTSADSGGSLLHMEAPLLSLCVRVAEGMRPRPAVIKRIERRKTGDAMWMLGTSDVETGNQTEPVPGSTGDWASTSLPA